MKPGFEIVEVNHAKETKPQEDRQEDSDEEDTRKISTYAVCRIENYDVEAIIDTGAEGCIVSKNLLDRLGWGIDKPTKMTIIVADGVEAIAKSRISSQVRRSDHPDKRHCHQRNVLRINPRERMAPKSQSRHRSQRRENGRDDPGRYPSTSTKEYDPKSRTNASPSERPDYSPKKK